MDASVNKRYNLYIALIILLSVIAGWYFRFKGLGKWPFAVDEYYFFKSTENIVKYGIPRYDSGGYYTRGIFQQYLTAILYMLGLKAEFGARLLPVLFNLLAIPGLYLLGKKLSGKTAAAVLIFIFCFSVWEVEFARFARMYSLFQTIFIWYLYFLYKNIFENNPKDFKWLWILSFLSIFVYEGSIFLSILNFIPIIWDREKQIINPFLFNVYKKKIITILISLILFYIGYKFMNFDFRFLNQPNLLPPEVTGYFNSRAKSRGGTLREPVLLILTLAVNKTWLFLFIVPAIINIIAVTSILKLKASIFTIVSFLTLLVLSILNLLGLIFILFLIFFLIGWIEPKFFERKSQIREISPGSKTGHNSEFIKLRSKTYRSLILAGLVNLIFWISFSVKTSAWHNLFPGQNISGAGLSVKTMLKASLNYPNLYETIVLFRDAIPKTSIIILILSGFLLLYIFRNYYKDESIKYRFLTFIFLILIFGVNIPRLTYFTTRYFYFLYPLALLLAVSGAKVTAESIFKGKEYTAQLAFGLIIIIFLAFSEDFNLRHLINIDSKEINYRVNLPTAVKEHYYQRWDIRTPAQIINKYAAPSDIVITNEQVNSFYLKKLDYIYIDYRGTLSGVSVDNGKKELWTSANLIYDDKKLIDCLIKKNNTKWVIVNTLWGMKPLQDDGFFRNFGKYAVYANPDSTAILYKIPGNISLN
jgi:hypothetical protein